MKKQYKLDKKNIDCPFCEMDTSKLANTILNETKYFYITPSLGSLVEGYILIISKRHINSMAELNAKEMNEYKTMFDEILNQQISEVMKKEKMIVELTETIFNMYKEKTGKKTSERIDKHKNEVSKINQTMEQEKKRLYEEYQQALKKLHDEKMYRFKEEDLRERFTWYYEKFSEYLPDYYPTQ